MKRFLIYALTAFTLSISFASGGSDTLKTKAPDSLKAIKEKKTDTNSVDQIVVKYLHSNHRCATCRKLEAYSHEALTKGFAEQLKDSAIIWQVVNFEEKGNEHFVKEYQLYSQALIISKVQNDKELKWKSLDNIWKLVGNKSEFISYVQKEIRDFMKPDEK